MKSFIRLVLLLGICFLHENTFSQDIFIPNSIAGTSSQLVVTSGIGILHPIGSKEKFSLGYGLRGTMVKYGKTDFWTAPKSVTKGKDENRDTLHLPSVNIFTLNVFVEFRYNFNDKLFAGFNIDVGGISFGKKKNGLFRAESTPFHKSIQEALPTNYNLLLVNENDIGSLNSQFFVGYNLNERLSLFAGVSHVFTEYSTINKLTFNNNRFRNISNLFILGAFYKL